MSKQSYVYIIHCKDLNTIKIGYSDNPFARLSQLQMGNSSELSIISIFKGGLEEESELHNIFKLNSVRGEWFSVDDDLIAELVSYQSEKVSVSLGSSYNYDNDDVDYLKDKVDTLSKALNNVMSFLDGQVTYLEQNKKVLREVSERIFGVSTKLSEEDCIKELTKLLNQPA
jgi:hypothetical protein